MLYHAFEVILKLLHPFMPYVTEAIWDHLPDRQSMLIVARWPAGGPTDDEAERELDLVINTVRAIRNARAEFRVDVNRRIPALIAAGPHLAALEAERAVIEWLARVQPLTISETLDQPPRQALHLLVSGIAIYLPLADMIDLEAERQRLSKELARLRGQTEALDRRLAEPGFTTKAPPEVIQKERARREALGEQIVKIEERLSALG